MRIAEFEKAFRAATADGAIQPTLATSGEGALTNTQLPEEFRAAANTLANRPAGPSGKSSLLEAAAQWT